MAVKSIENIDFCYRKLCGLLLVGMMFFVCNKAIKAQNILREDTTTITARKLYQRSFGAMLHSGGFGIQYRRFFRKTYYTRLGWEIMGAEMKPAKQVRVVNPYYGDSKSFVYGKLNTVLIARLGVGYQKIITRKPYFGGVELSIYYTGGFSLGLAKPIYLYILYLNNDNTDYQLISEAYDPEKHFADNIYGRAPFFDGIEHTSFHPGGYIHLGLNFEFGNQKEKPKSIEVGGILDLYPVAIPVMAYEDPNHYFLSIYIAFYFGKRY